MITVTGWSLEYFDEVSTADTIDMMKYWNDYPPTHVLLRGYVGYEPPMKSEPINVDSTTFDKMRATVPRGTQVDVTELKKVTGVRGRAKKVSKAPAHIQQIIQNVKKELDGR